jgi:perosamine synthetase
MNYDVAQDILVCVRRCLPQGESFPLHEPTFSNVEQDYLRRCIDSGWVSTAGTFIDEFESRLAAFTGAKYAVATVNGTSALHVCLQLAGVCANDEVIVPTLTFVATANAISYCGAVPHFADAAEDTLGIDPGKLENYLSRIVVRKQEDSYNRQTGRRIRAVVPVHTFGHPSDLDSLKEISSKFNLILVEDAAESLGSRYRGKHTGHHGHSGALSFNGNKIVTTGGGGAILTNSPETAVAARHLTTTARVPGRMDFLHDQVGYNYRMPNLNAALGIAQLEKIDSLIDRKRALAARYRNTFAGVRGVRVFLEPQTSKSNYWLNTILLDADDLNIRDAVLRVLDSCGIGARPAWRLMHRLPMYINCPRMELPVAESLERRIINLPSSAHYA